MKLGKEYYSDPKNTKNIPKGNLYSKVSQICKDYLGDSISSGKIFMIDSDLDGRCYLKYDKQVADWEKQEPNVWVSSFTKSIKFHNAADRTTYIIYKEK